MKIKFFLYFIFAFIFFYLKIETVFALQITKVDNTQTASSNPSSLQFVEIYNEKDVSEDITGYKLFDAGAPDRGHSLSSNNTENNFLIPAKTYFILSSSNTVKSIFIGCRVFKYTIAIGANDNISFKKDNSSSNSFLLSSINTLASTFCSQNNLIDNSTSTNQTSTSTNATTTDTNNSSSAANIVYVYLPINNQNKYGDITVLLPEEKLIPAGADTEFNVKAIDQNKKAISNLDFEWSFGDGGEKFGQKVDHHYTYPGEYTLVASADGYTVGGEAKMNVKVVTPDISISKVGTSSKENFIDLTNNTDYDLVLSNFYLNLDSNFYKLPKNFTILKRKTVHVSGEATGFNLPATNISLNYPNKNLLVSYANNIKNNNLFSSSSIQESNSINNESNLFSEDTSMKSYPQPFPKEREKILPLGEDLGGDKKELQTETIKQNRESFVLKRLILNNSESKNSSNKSETLNLNKSKNVDTGIVDWFKSLIY